MIIQRVNRARAPASIGRFELDAALNPGQLTLKKLATPAHSNVNSASLNTTQKQFSLTGVSLNKGNSYQLRQNLGLKGSVRQYYNSN
jgi:hypothetical protein